MFRKNFYTKFLSGALAVTMLLSLKAPFTFAKAPITPTVKTPKTSVKTVKSTLTQYDINTSFNEASKSFTCSETVKFTNTYGENLNSLAFHLYADSYGDVKTIPHLGIKKDVLEENEIGDITITKILIGNKVMDFTQDNQILKVKSNYDIKPNETIEVKINFTLKLPMSFDRLGYYEDVYSVTNWYPIISMYDTTTDKWDENPFCPTGESNYSDIANYNVSINVPEKMVLASTGTTKSSKKEKNSTKTYAVSAENVRDFVFIMSPNFKVLTKKCGDITVNSFYLKDDNVNDDIDSSIRADELLKLSMDALNFFGDTFGKYPYKEFDTVETYIEGFAMEYPQLVQMGKYSPNYTGDTNFLEDAIVHETGHQWWYVTVGNNEFKDSFLDESLNAFSTAYFFEKKLGKYASHGVTIGLRNKLDLFRGCSTPIYVPVDQIKDKELGKLVYGMGALVFENLRQKVGEEKFLKIIRTYYAKNTLKNATLDGLLSIIEEIGGKDAKDQVVSDINSKEFYPKHLALSKTELAEFKKTRIEATKSKREQIKEWLSSNKPEDINSFASFFLKAVDNFYVYLIKPSNVKMSEETKKNFDMKINKIKIQLENNFSVNVIIKEDKDMTEDELKENSIIFIGNDVENTALKPFTDKLPIELSKEEMKFTNATIKNNSVSGMLVSDTSKNINNTVLILLGLDKIDNFSILDVSDSYDKQFILNFGSKNLKGNYNN